VSLTGYTLFILHFAVSILQFAVIPNRSEIGKSRACSIIATGLNETLVSYFR